MRLEDIDPNFKIESSLERENLKYYDSEKAPFEISGIFREGEYFSRIPKEVAENMSEKAVLLRRWTAGGRIRFSTDSPYIAIYVEHYAPTDHPHFCELGQSGCDLYQYSAEDGGEIFIRPFMPNMYNRKKYERLIEVVGEGGMRSYTVYLPPYCSVSKVYVGLDANARVETPYPYRDIAPIVYYGHSITQGGCASKPGNSYPNMICQKTNIDFINLGFAGNARGEDAIINYVAGLDMSLFVLDYDYNAPSVEHLKVTHKRFYEKVREKNPDLPIIMMTRPKYRLNADELARNAAVRENFEDALKRGDTKVSFLDGRTLFDPFIRENALVDGIHPSDAGFASIARCVYNEIIKYIPLDRK